MKFIGRDWEEIFSLFYYAKREVLCIIMLIVIFAQDYCDLGECAEWK